MRTICKYIEIWKNKYGEPGSEMGDYAETTRESVAYFASYGELSTCSERSGGFRGYPGWAKPLWTQPIDVHIT